MTQQEATNLVNQIYDTIFNTITVALQDESSVAAVRRPQSLTAHNRHSK